MLQLISLLMHMDPEPNVINLLIRNPELVQQARKIDRKNFGARSPGRERARVHVPQLLAELDAELALRDVEKMLLQQAE